MKLKGNPLRLMRGYSLELFVQGDSLDDLRRHLLMMARDLERLPTDYGPANAIHYRRRRRPPTRH